MKLQTNEQYIPVRSNVSFARELYDRYGSMLLGYITDVVKDRQIAENYLVDIFSELPAHIDEYSSNEHKDWLYLQSFAKSKLASIAASRQDCIAFDNSVHQKWSSLGSQLASLSPMQRTVFCGMYYHQKSLKVIAEELKQPESVIKQILREVFTIIRNG